MLWVFRIKYALAFLFVLIILGFIAFSWAFYFDPPERISKYLKFFQAGLSFSGAQELETYELDFLDDFPPAFDLNVSFVDEPPEQDEIVEEMSFQDQLDDIAEKLDIIAQQVKELREEIEGPQDEETEEVKIEESEEEPEQEEEAQEQPEEENENELAIVNEPEVVKSGGGVNYPKILISEVQTASLNDSKQEFVELYNPNNQDIELTGWYLQRKTATGGVPSGPWSTYASKNLFSGKKIMANGYFLIARTDYYLGTADIFTNSSITDDNSFALKNPNGDISDQLGFGNAMDPELMAGPNPSPGQSVGRIVLTDGKEWETDNNFNDFELQTPTPRLKNKAWTEPEPKTGSNDVFLPTGSNDVFLPSEIQPIVINEVQISPTEQRFIELYNPNNNDVDLTGFYIQRKTKTATSWSSLVSSPNFNGKVIPANGYFLISWEIENSDILLGITLSENNSLVLKDQEGVILDKLGFGGAQDFETQSAPNPPPNQSITRINGTDTDNNGVDFIIPNTPTLGE